MTGGKRETPGAAALGVSVDSAVSARTRDLPVATRRILPSAWILRISQSHCSAKIQALGSTNFGADDALAGEVGKSPLRQRAFRISSNSVAFAAWLRQVNGRGAASQFGIGSSAHPSRECGPVVPRGATGFASIAVGKRRRPPSTRQPISPTPGTRTRGSFLCSSQSPGTLGSSASRSRCVTTSRRRSGLGVLGDSSDVVLRCVRFAESRCSLAKWARHSNSNTMRQTAEFPGYTL